MKILDQYLMKQISLGIATATIVLLPLFSFMDLIEQLDDVGTGFYEINDAFLYVLLTMPRRFIQVSPFIALLGNVAALGRLAISLELMSLRAAGFSPARIGMASLKVGLVLAVLIAILEFFVAPGLQQRAIAHRAAALEQSTEPGSNLGIWTRNDQQILRIDNLQHDTRLASIEIIRLDDNGFLSEYIHAQGFEIINSRQWILLDVTRKLIEQDRITLSTTESMPWDTFLRPEQISTLTKPHDSLSPVELSRYIEHLRSTGQEANVYALTLWKKLGGVFTMLGMLLLSVPFVFGSVRTGFANRLVLAGVTGIIVYLLDQIFSNAGLILNLNPILVAIVPSLLLIGFARSWLVRMH
jgi:lipopolysaccharide export system permease protein